MIHTFHNLTLAEMALENIVEIVQVKQDLSDSFWAIAGQGVQGERYNRLTGKCQRLMPQPSHATAIAQG